ncbi:(2R)-3-sulfolactate dehydrogenase (NADP+) [Limimonas halophila]|uniref:(2R)-3-sulfolactate dehydrogenase (NADP+) n=1 Tax=Limimonas halophila TaxID=1082479 RepID=A0A1G7L3F3_9PROT|nr:Ldh family oxidoreductase [Limimonas halophila]SDF43983.1 (2R)-3-sulfolactate dehydrogenase (NADP+) [Limimonas halophila]
MTVTLSLTDVEDLTRRALLASGVAPGNAESVTQSVVAAERDGIHSHGLARLPTYCEHARCGKIDGRAEPTRAQPRAGTVLVDARDGFAHPAIDLGFDVLPDAAREAGIAAMAVTNSYNCGVVGYHVERLAEQGLVALGFVNAPASIAPWGGHKATFGTNPLACAVPRANAAPLVIDQSSSVVAKSEVMVHKQKGEPLPEGWALDADGNPTTDPEAALAGGTMVPAGGYKGANQALVVEVFAAALTASSLSIDASSFANNQGGSPETGQFFVAVDPNAFAGAMFADKVERLLGAIGEQEGTRLPGQGRLKARSTTAEAGVAIKQDLYDKIRGYAEG